MLRDFLIALIATYFILLIPELILPGIVSSHFNPQYLLIFILLLGLVYSKIGGRTKTAENPKFRAISRNLLNVILFVIALMLILSLYKMNIWEIVLVIAISIPLLISAENILIKEK
jgi:cell division protein FtsW (lipid II flippase)